MYSYYVFNVFADASGTFKGRTASRLSNSNKSVSSNSVITRGTPYQVTVMNNL